jgi:hypothetical protein
MWLPKGYAQIPQEITIQANFQAPCNFWYQMSVNHFKKLIRVLFAAWMVVVGGCATVPPVQEMSDARQALQAAKAVGAQDKAPLSYSEALTYIERAESSLQMGNYSEAQRQALKAKNHALEARSEAIKSNP